MKKTPTSHGSIAFIHFCLLDLVLDALLLNLSLLGIPPPDGALIFALHVEVVAGSTGRVFLVTLLPTQTARKAS